MFQLRLRLLPMLALALFLLGTWGWLLPAHLCRMPSDCMCEQVDACCEEEAVQRAVDECCFEVDNYFNFPVYSIERLPAPSQAFFMLAEALHATAEWIQEPSCIFLLTDRPPPLSVFYRRLHLSLCSIRV